MISLLKHSREASLVSSRIRVKMKERLEEIVDQALKSAPTYRLSDGFKDQVVKMIRKKERTSQRKFYFLLTFGVLSFVIIGFILLVHYFPTLITGSNNVLGIKEINRSIPFAILIGIAIAVIQYLDKKLVKDKMILH